MMWEFCALRTTPCTTWLYARRPLAQAACLPPSAQLAAHCPSLLPSSSLLTMIGRLGCPCSIGAWASEKSAAQEMMGRGFVCAIGSRLAAKHFPRLPICSGVHRAGNDAGVAQPNRGNYAFWAAAVDLQPVVVALLVLQLVAALNKLPPAAAASFCCLCEHSCLCRADIYNQEVTTWTQNNFQWCQSRVCECSLSFVSRTSTLFAALPV